MLFLLQSSSLLKRPVLKILIHGTADLHEVRSAHRLMRLLHLEAAIRRLTEAVILQEDLHEEDILLHLEEVTHQVAIQMAAADQVTEAVILQAAIHHAEDSLVAADSAAHHGAALAVEAGSAAEVVSAADVADHEVVTASITANI